MNDTTQNALNAIFGISEQSVATIAEDATLVPSEVLPPVQTESTTEAEQKAAEDFEFSRERLRELANTGRHVLDRAVTAAEQTDKASSFAAVAELMRATIESHRELSDLHKRHAEVRISSQAQKSPTAQVNIEKGVVFNGTSEDLLRMIDKSRQ